MSVKYQIVATLFTGKEENSIHLVILMLGDLKKGL